MESFDVERPFPKHKVGVGMIGCGAIGTTIAYALCNRSIPDAELISVYDKRHEKAEELALNLKVESKRSFDEFLNSKGLEMVVEAASQEAVREYAVRVLDAGKDILIMSVGALLDEDLYDKVCSASKRYEGRIYVASGSVAGIDGIRAAVAKGLDEVVLTTRKHPKTFADSPYARSSGLDLNGVKEPMVVYEGPAVEAVRHFPANINVAATLSLAGIGPKRTRVRIIADPALNQNVHEVYARGSFGEMQVIMRNLPHPSNPKTSYIAALSAVEMLKTITSEDMRVGS